MNEEYKSLKQLQNTINTIKDLETQYEALTQKKEKIASTTIDFKHTHFPYAKAVKDLEAKAKSKSMSTSILRTLITVLFSVIIAGIITGVYYVLYSQDIMPTVITDYHTYILYGLPILFLIISYILSHRKIKHFLIERRKKRIINKNKVTLKEAKEQSIQEAERYKQELDTRIKHINQELKTTDINIKGHKQKLEKQSPLPDKYMHALDAIIMYFEDKRAESLKESINLYVKETQDKTRYTRLLYAIKDENIPVDVLLDDNADLDTYKTLHINTPQSPPKPKNTSVITDDPDTTIKDETNNIDNNKEKSKETSSKDNKDESEKKVSKKSSKKEEDLKVYTND